MYARDRERRMVMKPYVKPELHYESFELAQHIAGCSLTPKSVDPMTCAYDGVINGVDYDLWFIDGNNVCGVPVEDYCYANSNSNITTINS